MKIATPCLSAYFLLAFSITLGQQPASSDKLHGDLVPQNLLRLIHASEVQHELGLNDVEVQRLEAFFKEIDGHWFRSRVLPASEQRQVISKLEGRLHGWLRENLTASQRDRLQQLEYRSLGTRMLLRSDVSQSIGLDAEQIQQFAGLAQATSEIATKWQQARMANSEADEQQAKLVEAQNAELQAVQTILREYQRMKLVALLGEPFDTAKLERIYPMAPGLEPVKDWINSSPLRWEELRGKVVVLHFYAFQCHNCHANFDHYQKWHEEFSERGVVVLGIQTPETQREREPSAVRDAASAAGLAFPILVDLESKNWKAWANTMWPTVYVIDQQGYIRYLWQGELNWAGATQDQTIHDLILRLLDEQA
jgi:peroxiredoxin